jgi:hypothetical protein
MSTHDLNRLEEERIHFKYLLTEFELAPDFRSAIQAYLERVEKLIQEAKNSK